MFKVFMLYEVNPTTWFYLSLLMITGIFFKFRRIWSVRNLDLFLLLSLGPALLLIAYDFYFGYVAMFASLLVILVRMLCDPLMTRRPLLEVNLSKGGLIFCCVALMMFQIASLVLTQTREVTESQVNSSLEQLMMFNLNRRLLQVEMEQKHSSGELASGEIASRNGALGEIATEDDETASSPQKSILVHGPGLPFFTKLADFPRKWRYERMKKEYLAARAEDSAVDASNPPNAVNFGFVTEKEINLSSYPLVQLNHFPLFPLRQVRWTILLATLAQAGIVVGIVLIGWTHFENFNTGVAAATLYLLLPYVVQTPSRLDHLIPALLVIWAIYSWRLPALAGVLLGTAAALNYYPLFLLPLWFAFYWSRGFYRFMITSLSVFLLLITISIPLAGGFHAFLAQSGDIFGCVGLFSRNATGFWDIQNHSVFYRLPVIALYLMLVLFLTFWPTQKNFGVLMSSSAALMIGTQFCHPFQGGTYMAWFLPLVILIVLRPNLEDRTAVKMIGRSKRKKNKESVEAYGVS